MYFNVVQQKEITLIRKILERNNREDENFYSYIKSNKRNFQAQKYEETEKWNTGSSRKKNGIEHGSMNTISCLHFYEGRKYSNRLYNPVERVP